MTYDMYDMVEEFNVDRNSKQRCVSMVFRIAIYQPIIMPYQARCCGISALWQERYQG